MEGPAGLFYPVECSRNEAKPRADDSVLCGKEKENGRYEDDSASKDKIYDFLWIPMLNFFYSNFYNIDRTLMHWWKFRQLMFQSPGMHLYAAESFTSVDINKVDKSQIITGR